MQGFHPRRGAAGTLHSPGHRALHQVHEFALNILNGIEVLALNGHFFWQHNYVLLMLMSIIKSKTEICIEYFLHILIGKEQIALWLIEQALPREALKRALRRMRNGGLRRIALWERGHTFPY